MPRALSLLTLDFTVSIDSHTGRFLPLADDFFLELCALYSCGHLFSRLFFLLGCGLSSRPWISAMFLAFFFFL